MNLIDAAQHLEFKEEGHNRTLDSHEKTQTWENWSSYAKSWNQEANIPAENRTRDERRRNEANVRRNWDYAMRNVLKRTALKGILRRVKMKGHVHPKDGTFSIGLASVGCSRAVY